MLQTIQYGYDANGLMIGRRVVGADGTTETSKTGFVRQGLQVLAELDLMPVDPIITELYLHGTEPNEIVATDVLASGDYHTVWGFTDALGSLSTVASKDFGGWDVVHSITSEYGGSRQQLGDTSVLHLMSSSIWAGHHFDEDTGLTEAKARWYDPTTGRFISQDPLGFEAGDENLYRYVGNGPTNATDPNGLEGLGVFYTGPNIVAGLNWAWSVLKPEPELPHNYFGPDPRLLDEVTHYGRTNWTTIITRDIGVLNSAMPYSVVDDAFVYAEATQQAERPDGFILAIVPQGIYEWKRQRGATNVTNILPYLGSLAEARTGLKYDQPGRAAMGGASFALEVAAPFVGRMLPSTDEVARVIAPRARVIHSLAGNVDDAGRFTGSLSDLSATLRASQGRGSGWLNRIADNVDDFGDDVFHLLDDADFARAARTHNASLGSAAFMRPGAVFLQRSRGAQVARDLVHEGTHLLDFSRGGVFRSGPHAVDDFLKMSPTQVYKREIRAFRAERLLDGVYPFGSRQNLSDSILKMYPAARRP